jgi:hypothetical protein
LKQTSLFHNPPITAKNINVEGVDDDDLWPAFSDTSLRRYVQRMIQLVATPVGGAANPNDSIA